MRRKFLPQKDGLILGPRTLTVNDDGIDLVKEHYKSSTKWQGVRNVAETNVHFFIMLDNLTGHIVPKRAFPDEASLQEFSSLINSKSVPRHEYSYDKQMRKVLWSRRFIRLALIFLIVFYVYEHYYAYRPCDSEYSSMYWEPVSKYTGNTESQAVIFTCVNNPEIGFIGYTNEDLLDMLNGSEDGSIVLKLDNNTADTTVPVVSYHTVEFYELDTLDFSSENRFVSCPE